MLTAFLSWMLLFLAFAILYRIFKCLYKYERKSERKIRQNKIREHNSLSEEEKINIELQKKEDALNNLKNILEIDD